LNPQRHPSAAKADTIFASNSARLKPCPFKSVAPCDSLRSTNCPARKRQMGCECEAKLIIFDGTLRQRFRCAASRIRVSDREGQCRLCRPQRHSSGSIVVVGKEVMSEAGALETLVNQKIVIAMKAHDGERTTTLRLIKNALKNKAIEKREAPTQAESEQVLATMIKQRRDSIEQFTKGNRLELAAKEAGEIVVIEEFLPKALDDAGLAALVAEAVAEVTATLGNKPSPKEMGHVMKAVQARLAAAGARAEGRTVSDLVKKQLAG